MNHFLLLATASLLFIYKVSARGAAWPPKERKAPISVQSEEEWESSLNGKDFDINSFTWDDYELLSQKRIRKEVRALSDDQWQRIVDALWIMKNVDQDTGREIYGTEYRSYDSMVCQHALCALSTWGDQGHRNPVVCDFFLFCFLFFVFIICLVFLEVCFWCCLNMPIDLG